ncbi:CU044_5270 family protein [Saccharopolyspora sp. NPDC000359]|uniref:CU044_5270 family protein n=1 Tax=Saccharopolyspora sp. NPDC000359 TaxID=3154251 RepID=UPI00333497A7
MDVDEMELVKHFKGSAQLPDQQQLAPARHRLIAAAVEERTGTAPARLGRGRRLVWPTAVTVGLAATISGIFALTPVGEVGGQTPVANAEAAQVLQSAADAALQRPDTPPQPDQFIYLRSETLTGPREAWLSADGTREGLYVEGDGAPGKLPGCSGSAYQESPDTPADTGRCTPEPHYDPSLPSDPDEMMYYLQDPERARDPNAVGVIRQLLTESYMRPEAMAALFEAAAKIPGVAVVPDAKDPSGRSGIGVSLPNPDGPPEVLIFDRNSYAFLGTQNSAQLELYITDQPGHRPR